ncbi:MAG TPA: TIGR02147 family protein [Thermoanaerobaculia bacterium]
MKSLLSGTPSTPQSSFRLLLQSELARRCAANAQYSLRAFAMQLEVDHSSLSQWLRGRRAITRRTIETLGAKLDLPEEVIARYVENAARDGDPQGDDSRDSLSGDTIALIAGWEHFAILELTRLQEFRPDSRWIARVLGIGVDLVNVALQRLIRLGLLEMAAEDRWVDLSGDAVANLEQIGGPTIEELFVQAGRLSAASLSAAAPARREHLAITLAVAGARVPRAIAMIVKFRQQLIDELEAEPADDVYRLEIALYPVTTLAREKETPR